MANRRHSLAHPGARVIRGAWQSHLLTASLLLLSTPVGMSPADPQVSRGFPPCLMPGYVPSPRGQGSFSGTLVQHWMAIPKCSWQTLNIDGKPLRWMAKSRQ